VEEVGYFEGWRVEPGEVEGFVKGEGLGIRFSWRIRNKLEKKKKRSLI